MIVVTGASGFLGGGLASALAMRGDKVRAVQRSDVPRLRELGVEVRATVLHASPAAQLLLLPNLQPARTPDASFSVCCIRLLTWTMMHTICIAGGAC
jgi:nucleoside-diphosphate-sugar epimerase